MHASAPFDNNACVLPVFNAGRNFGTLNDNPGTFSSLLNKSCSNSTRSVLKPLLYTRKTYFSFLDVSRNWTTLLTPPTICLFDV